MTQVTISLTDEQTKSLFNTEELLLTLTEDDKKQIALELYKEAMKVEVDMAVQRHKSDIWYRTNMNDLITPIIKDLLKENEDLNKLVDKIIPSIKNNIPEIVVGSISSLLWQNLNNHINNTVLFSPVIEDIRNTLKK
jgi:S-adenosylmethionine synthetase